jgi:hypothetical protein
VQSGFISETLELSEIAFSLQGVSAIWTPQSAIWLDALLLLTFFRNPEDYNLAALTRSKYGYLCVEGMTVPAGETIDTDTGLHLVQLGLRTILQTDSRCKLGLATLHQKSFVQ